MTWMLKGSRARPRWTHTRSLYCAPEKVDRGVGVPRRTNVDIDHLSKIIDRPEHVSWHAHHFDAGLVQRPFRADLVPIRAGGFLVEWREALHPV